MTSSGKLRLATLGLGNWAGRMVDLLLKMQGTSIELLNVCEPNLQPHAKKAFELKHAGIHVVESLDDVLSDKRVEGVYLPVPIHLHRPFTEKCLAAGKAVLVEKPVAGCVQDVDAMIAARDRFQKPALVSFQDTYDPAMLRLKREILNGSIGQVQSASLIGCWPRDESYYQRTTWAGKIRAGDTWVLDSPVTNAFAHYLHLTLFLLGDAETSWAQPTSVEAELYRVYDIENYDTASQRFMAAGVPVLVLLTHACRQSIGPIICLQGNSGSLRVDLSSRTAQVSSTRGTRMIQLSADSRMDAINAFAAHVKHRETPSALSTLEAARAHVVATNGASQAALVRTLPEEFIGGYISPDGDPGRFIPGIEHAMLACVEQQQMLHESSLVPWSVPPGQLSLLGYSQFTGCPLQSTFVGRMARSKVTRHAGDETGIGSAS